MLVREDSERRRGNPPYTTLTLSCCVGHEGPRAGSPLWTLTGGAAPRNLSAPASQHAQLEASHVVFACPAAGKKIRKCETRTQSKQSTFLRSTHTLRAQKWVPKRIISRNTAPPVPFLAPIRSATAGRALTRRPFVDRVGNRRVTDDFVSPALSPALSWLSGSGVTQRLGFRDSSRLNQPNWMKLDAY